MALPTSNFLFLKRHDEQLVRLGQLAERYFPEDPNTCLLKLRQLAELLAQLTATRVGSYVSADEKQFELLQRLEREKILTREVAQLFFVLFGFQSNHTAASLRMTTISPNRKLVTLINVFTVEPANQQKLLELLTRAPETSVRHAPGFISASLHRGIDGTKVTMYAQWRSVEDYLAMRENPVPSPSA